MKIREEIKYFVTHFLFISLVMLIAGCGNNSSGNNEQGSSDLEEESSSGSFEEVKEININALGLDSNLGP